jgi:hypothetical protein
MSIVNVLNCLDLSSHFIDALLPEPSAPFVDVLPHVGVPLCANELEILSYSVVPSVKKIEFF